MKFEPNGHCMTCGMRILPVSRKYYRNGKKNNKVYSFPKTYCNKTCADLYTKYPDQFGHWWKKIVRQQPEPEFVQNMPPEPKYVTDFNIEHK